MLDNYNRAYYVGNTSYTMYCKYADTQNTILYQINLPHCSHAMRKNNHRNWLFTFNQWSVFDIWTKWIMNLRRVFLLLKSVAYILK